MHVEGYKDTFLKRNKFWKQDEMTTILPANATNIASEFAAAADTSSVDHICMRQRRLAAVSLSLARIHGKCKKIVNFKFCFFFV